MLKKIIEESIAELEKGKTVVLASIVGASGSTPRSVGAMMAVGENGVLGGTIGGGELEYQCAHMAMDPEAPVMTFSLTNQDAASLGMVCGGDTQVLFTPINDICLLKNCLSHMAQMGPGWLLLPLDSSAPTLKTDAEAGLQQHPYVTFICGRTCLSVPLRAPGRVFLLGGGHVALELSKILDILSYPYIVIDDRSEFASQERFPGAMAAITCDFSQLLHTMNGQLMAEAQDCICIMTRGHSSDTDALRFALKTPAGYIGLMGSRRKRERVFAQLLSEGFSDAPERIITPIGLPISGETPGEIAVSIAAQLVAHRNQKKSEIRE